MNYGVVAEFNPFHNGHKAFLDAVKSEGGTVSAVMSECFVQRGETASLRPGARTLCALKNGVDLVLALPVTFAVSSAENFAFGGVSVLSSCGVFDALAFGSECGDSRLLEDCADALLQPGFDKALLSELKSGVSYPAARQNALSKKFGDVFSHVLSSPNDTLAVEYIKAAKKLSFNPEFKAVKRIGALHDSLGGEGDIRSASEIRTLFGAEFSRFVPENVFEIYESEVRENKAPVDFSKLEGAMLYALRNMTQNDFKCLPDVSEGLDGRIYAAVREGKSLKEILESSKTKRYTYSRLKRILLCAFLGISADMKKAGVPYIRVLGFTKKGKELLREMKLKASLPVVTNYGDIKKLGEKERQYYELESRVRDIFSLAEPVPDICGTLMTDKIIKL